MGEAIPADSPLQGTVKRMQQKTSAPDAMIELQFIVISYPYDFEVRQFQPNSGNPLAIPARRRSTAENEVDQVDGVGNCNRTITVSIPTSFR